MQSLDSELRPAPVAALGVVFDPVVGPHADPLGNGAVLLRLFGERPLGTERFVGRLKRKKKSQNVILICAKQLFRGGHTGWHYRTPFRANGCISRGRLSYQLSHECIDARWTKKSNRRKHPPQNERRASKARTSFQQPHPKSKTRKRKTHHFE